VSVDDWTLEHHTGSADALHRRPWPEPLHPTVWLLEPDRPAVILGSAQGAEAIDAEVATGRGWEVATRRSGGGAVLLVPGEAVWIDVFVPRGHSAWDDDVHRASVLVGSAWAAAVDAVRPTSTVSRLPAVVHTGELTDRVTGSIACFAGVGPGEVLVGGRKVVGLSQRRTRAGARVQGVVYRHHDPAALPSVLRSGSAELREALRRVGELDVAPRVLAEALVASLAHRF
jgi:lipoate-protein ligase A